MESCHRISLLKQFILLVIMSYNRGQHIFSISFQIISFYYVIISTLFLYYLDDCPCFTRGQVMDHYHGSITLFILLYFIELYLALYLINLFDIQQNIFYIMRSTTTFVLFNVLNQNKPMYFKVVIYILGYCNNVPPNEQQWRTNV